MPDAAPRTVPPLPAAVEAFERMAPDFDARFGAWESVAAQRRAVRRYLLAAFPTGARLLELAGGTGEDALFLAAEGRTVLLTDGSPAMVARASAKAAQAGLGHRVTTRQLLLEELESTAHRMEAGGAFDGAYANFAGLNCVADLRPVARGLAGLLPEGAQVLLVVFGPLPPGEILTQLLRGRPGHAVRRLRRRGAAARVGGAGFQVHYPTPRSVARSFSPWFRRVRVRGIGILVPPSAAEPFISRAPLLVRTLERMDRLLAMPLALLGDHVLLHLVRTAIPAGQDAA